MPRTTMTSKGQITVPQEVRTALGLAVGDQLLIQATETGFEATVVRKPSASSLRGLLAGPVAYGGEEAELAAVNQALAHKYGLKR